MIGDVDLGSIVLQDKLVCFLFQSVGKLKEVTRLAVHPRYFLVAYFPSFSSDYSAELLIESGRGPDERRVLEAIV